MDNFPILYLCGLLALPLSGACAGSPGATSIEGPFKLVGAEAFDGYNPTMKIPAFDLITADIDLDGDPDLLINWHHLGPLELFENRAGTYRAVDTGDGARSGLVENARAPGLFRSALEAEAAIEAHGQAGLYVWHDPERLGAWQFLWTDPSDRYHGCTLHLTTSLQIEEVVGLDPADIHAEDERHRRLRIPAGTRYRRFHVKTDPVGVRLEVSLEGAEIPALFAGVPPTRQPDGRVALWKPDPHGMAWVDVEGTPHPELFITRGGLSGQLLPPLAPKTDRYYVAGAGGTPYRLTEARVPPGYGRGRSVEWVDIDNDGRLELSITNEAGANQLLVHSPDGTFVDRAVEFGVGLESATVCWGDANRDGFQDLFYLDPDGVKILLNRGGNVFEPPIGNRFEMNLPRIEPRDESNLFDRAVLRLADFDADGDLDVWVLGRGPERRNHLFLREESGFRDATGTTGFGAVIGNETSVLADFDNDGYEDMFVLGRTPALWLNDRGRRLRSVTMPFVVPPWIEAAAAADVNQDGRVDLVLAGRTRYLLENRMGAAGNSFEVTLRDPKGNPIGAVVTAVYADGRRVARRLGSDRTAFSQRAEPLRFAVGESDGARRIEVRWPGDKSATIFKVPAEETSVVLKRGPS